MYLDHKSSWQTEKKDLSSLLLFSRIFVFFFVSFNKRKKKNWNFVYSRSFLGSNVSQFICKNEDGLQTHEPQEVLSFHLAIFWSINNITEPVSLSNNTWNALWWLRQAIAKKEEEEDRQNCGPPYDACL